MGRRRRRRHRLSDNDAGAGGSDGGGNINILPAASAARLNASGEGGSSTCSVLRCAMALMVIDRFETMLDEARATRHLALPQASVYTRPLGAPLCDGSQGDRPL